MSAEEKEEMESLGSSTIAAVNHPIPTSTTTSMNLLAYDTRNIMTTPPSPPGSWDYITPSIQNSNIGNTMNIEESWVDMNRNDFDPSSSSHDITFSKDSQSQGILFEVESSDTPKLDTPYNSVTAVGMNTTHLSHTSWPDILLDIQAAVSISQDKDTDTEQGLQNDTIQEIQQEEEQALLPNKNDLHHDDDDENENSKQQPTTEIASDALYHRLNSYKQPCIDDDDDDTTSNQNQTVLQDEEEDILFPEYTIKEHIVDKYQYLEDLYHEENDEPVEPSTTMDLYEPQGSIEQYTVDNDDCSSTMILNTNPLQFKLEKEVSQQSISFNPLDMNVNRAHDSNNPSISTYSTKAIPLIQPPPVEKVRKWIMSKPSLRMTQSLSTSLQMIEQHNSDNNHSFTTTMDNSHSSNADIHVVGASTSPSLDDYHHSYITTESSSNTNDSDWANFHEGGLNNSESNIPWNENSSLSHDDRIPLNLSSSPMELERIHYNIPRNQISPSPFELAIIHLPSIITMALTFLGDPAAVCHMKRVNRFCYKAITENEHVLMKDAVRLGGLKTTLRPAFWMWITLEKCQRTITSQVDHHHHHHHTLGHEGHLDISEYENYANIGKDGKWSVRIDSDVAQEVYFLTENECEVSLKKSFRWVTSRSTRDFQTLSKCGEDSKWQAIIERDVRRAFGNMPPHKSGAKFKADSIVKALVTWGRNRFIKRGVKGGGESSPLRRIGIRQSSGFLPETLPPWENSDHDSESVISESPTDTVSDWGGITQISPVGSRLDDIMEKSSDLKKDESSHENHSNTKNANEYFEIALCGNGLTSEKKSELQNRLRFILYALSSAHEEVGYCQGMDYVVAHLLRVLQDTIEWKALLGKPFPPIISTSNIEKNFDQSKDRAILVEEVVFRVMDTFLTTYGLRHFYWPELRCLKTACRVFEWLVHQKLPVLSDHFEHHELNVGLFALGWFQTLFLYIPAMPSTTINHMWDIWLVERSMKIFFRVATAILFLSQPTLLNHDQEGMMIYLNTFPDATLLKQDILIPCALQIKVTNKMLMDIEKRVSRDNDVAHGFEMDINRSETVDQQQLCASCSNSFDCNNLTHAFE